MGWNKQNYFACIQHSCLKQSLIHLPACGWSLYHFTSALFSCLDRSYYDILSSETLFFCH